MIRYCISHSGYRREGEREREREEGREREGERGGRERGGGERKVGWLVTKLIRVKIAVVNNVAL